MISNPVGRFTTGGNFEDFKVFTYEGGSKLYHFSPHDNGLSSDLRCNVVFFANSREHAEDVLRRMFTFVIESARVHATNKPSNQRHAEREIQLYSSWLKALDEGKITLVEAPTNQFYKVGYAANDTI